MTTIQFEVPLLENNRDEIGLCSELIFSKLNQKIRFSEESLNLLAQIKLPYEYQTLRMIAKKCLIESGSNSQEIGVDILSSIIEMESGEHEAASELLDKIDSAIESEYPEIEVVGVFQMNNLVDNLDRTTIHRRITKLKDAIVILLLAYPDRWTYARKFVTLKGLIDK